MDRARLWPEELPDDIVAVDLMGNGQFIRDLQAEGHHIRGVGVELSDTRRDIDKQRDAAYGNGIVVGDVWNRGTWNNVLAALNGAVPNLIICRGVGGVDSLPSSRQLSYILLDRAYRLLDSKDGILLSQVQAQNRYLLEEWQASAVSSGFNLRIPAWTVEPRLRIMKDKNSPTRLPAIEL